MANESATTFDRFPLFLAKSAGAVPVVYRYIGMHRVAGEII